MRRFKKIAVFSVCILAAALLFYGMIVADANIRLLAFADDTPTLSLYAGKNGDAMFKFFDSNINLSQTFASAIDTLKSIGEVTVNGIEKIKQLFN